MRGTLGEDPAKLAWTDDATPATLTRVEAALAGVADWAFHETPTGVGVHQRLLSHQVTVCWDDDAVDALPIREMGNGELGNRCPVDVISIIKNIAFYYTLL